MFNSRGNLSGYIFAMLATIIWSGNFVIARGLSELISPINLAFLRWTTALIFFLPFALKSLIKEIHFVKENMWYFIITSFLGVTVFNTLIYFAGRTTNATNLSLISITFPIFTVIFSKMVFKEKITLNKSIGIVLVAFGVLTLVTKGDLFSLRNMSFAIGDLFMLLAAFIFAVYSILLKKKPAQMNVFAFQLATFIIGLIFLFPAVIFENLNSAIVVPEKGIIYSVFYLGIFASLTAFILWNKAILVIGPSKSSMVYYTLPLFSSLLAFVFLQESISFVHIVSSLFIIPGILIANFESKSKAVA